MYKSLDLVLKGKIERQHHHAIDKGVVIGVKGGELVGVQCDLTLHLERFVPFVQGTGAKFPPAPRKSFERGFRNTLPLGCLRNVGHAEIFQIHQLIARRIGFPIQNRF